MQDANYQKFEGELHADMERLAQSIREQKQRNAEHVPDRELVRQQLEPLIRSQLERTVETDRVEEPATDTEKELLPEYLEKSPKEIRLRLQSMIQETFNNGLGKTLSNVKSLDPFWVDAFHDVLTDNVYDELKKRNLL